MRRRYLALKIMSGERVNEGELVNSIWDAVYQLFGEYGASRVNLTLINHDSLSNCAVIRCSQKTLDMVRASIASITNIKEKKVAIQVVRVSGTLKALKKKWIR